MEKQKKVKSAFKEMRHFEKNKKYNKLKPINKDPNINWEKLKQIN